MTKTSIVMADRATTDSEKARDTLIVAGEVADLRIHNEALSLRASKLLHLLVRAAGADVCARVRHSVSIGDLNAAFHLSIADLIATVRELASTEVELRYTNARGRRVVKIGPMLADLERDLDDYDEDDPAVVTWEFSPVMLVLLANSDHWAALSRQAVLAFEGRYSLRLYELVSLRGGLQFKRNERFDLDDLRRRLGVEPGKLERWIHFKQRVLDPAIAEVNHISGLAISYELVKTGRKVTAIVMSWRELDKAGRAAQAEELMRGRLGRKARRAGSVEAIADAAPVVAEFPAFGTIRFTPWEAIAKANLPAPARDLDAVQREFVSWARAGGKPLKGENVTAMFAGFCRGQAPAS